ncbi:hypothetical protein OS493_018684 [Desmophyllum pertusum]|uniref:Rhodanese domain-containing protein n=1 Tax=Desmophyllum pertusum TaxID=174260 RepID=A0A9W9ZP80_9CNID|nr:hypothetical protein OS493_018684 [Desmophyllum pertusum]
MWWVGALKSRSSLLREILPKPFLYTRTGKLLFPSSLDINSRQSRHLSSDSTLPTEAQIVVCGGGIVGCSVAYHLAKLGWKDVLLLEQGNLTCGTTWHAAGLLGKLRSSAAETKLASYSVELYSTLEEETGLGTGFKRCGGLVIAQSKERMALLKRRAAMGRALDIDTEIVSIKEIQKLFPLDLRTDDILGGLWIPSEGVATSSDVCQSLAKGATLNGVKIFEKATIESIVTDGKSITAVETSSGTIKCEILVNCGGLWAWEIGQKSEPKVSFPLHSTEHSYLVTKPIEGIPSTLPVIRDHDGQIYFREWSGGLMSGGFEKEAIPVFFHEAIPKGFEYQLLPENWDHFVELMDKMLHRLPLMETAEIRHMTNGPESFTPDSRYLLGEVPEVRNFYVAAGFNSGGIANAGGAGMALAAWITAGEPTMDLSSVDIRRFAPHHNNKRYLQECVKETLSWHYLLRFPYSERKRVRGVRCSPLFSDLDAAGASWGDKMGWEVAKWFSLPGEDHPHEDGFGKPSWLTSTEVEYKACTDGVAVVDLTSLGLFEIESPIDGEHGGIELSCTVIRNTQNRFMILLDDSERVTVAQSLISRIIPSDSAITFRNIQSGYVILGVLGPSSRQLLQTLTQTSLDDGLFPVNTAKDIDLGYASGVKALRTSFFGDQENDWKLLVPSEFAVCLYRDLMEAGRDLGARNAGRSVVDCLRIERVIPQIGSEMTSFVTPWEAGMKDRVQLDKNCDFIGKQALLDGQHQDKKKRLVHLALQEHDDNNYPWGGELILRNGSVVGSTTSACHSFKRGHPVCLGYVEGEGQDSVVLDGQLEIDIAGSLFPVSVSVSRQKSQSNLQYDADVSLDMK